MVPRSSIPRLILVLSLLTTAIITWNVAQTVSTRDRERLDNAIQNTRTRIEVSLNTGISLIRSGAGLLAAIDGPLQYTDFRKYTDMLDLRRRFPGLLGFGYTQRFAPEERDSLEARMRAQGFSDFAVWPRTDTVEQFSILYLAPLDVRNRAAIGYNMYSEPVRRAAMARARDTGMSAMSGKVTLVQEIEERKQAGFLIYFPVYRAGATPPTVAERRALLQGFVYSPYRVDDLFNGIFASDASPLVAYRVYDGYEVNEENLMHDSRMVGNAPAPSHEYDTLIRLESAGRTWTISFAPTAYFIEESRRWFIPVTAVTGLLLSLMLFGFSQVQYRAGESARQSEQRLRHILESLPVGVFVAEKTGYITFTNTVAQALWSRNEPFGTVRYDDHKGWWPESGRPIQDPEWALARALRGETVESEIIDIETADGVRKTILQSAFPLRNAAGQIERAVAAMADITAQRSAEAALREREREFRTMVDSIPQLAWVADDGANPLWYNHRWFDYSGLSSEGALPDAWPSVVHPDHLARFQSRVREAVRTGAFWEDTFPLRSKSGEYRQFLFQWVPIHDEAGKVARWFGTSTDITEQVRAQEAEARALREQLAREAAEERETQLRAHAAELERSNRELQDFAYIASHDLQEPLRKINSFSGLVLEEYGAALDETGRHYLKRLQHAAQRMSLLIKDLLAFSRVRTKVQPFTSVSLNDVLEDVRSDLDFRLHQTSGRLIAEDLPDIEADPLQMHQLLLNLIGNALKFHRPGMPPEVHVTGTLEEAPGWAGKHVCRLVVEDNGIGFDEKYLDRIFTPFQQLHGKDSYEGTGIGLAICRRIVDRHNGTITASSRPGQGSRFEVVLPATQDRVMAVSLAEQTA